MNLPVNFFMWLLAALPIIVLLILMAKFQWGAAKAAPIGLLISTVTALVFYKAPVDLVVFESLKGLWNAFTVLIVIWPAILIFEVTHEAHAFDAFRKGMQKLSPNELLQILAIGWIFVSFLQGITGFGVPVAVGAPLLVGMGVQPLWAVTIALMGHAWANTFGTLAVAWDALVLQTNLQDSGIFSLTALWAASFIWVFNAVAGVSICWWYGKKEGVKKGLPAVMIISLIHGGGQLFLTQLNPTLAAFVPACIALGVVFILGKLPLYNTPWSIETSRVMNRAIEAEEGSAGQKTLMGLHQAFVPYYALIVITLSILLITPIKRLFGMLQLGFGFPETATGYGIVNAATPLYSPFRPFTHAGVFLFIAAVLGYIYFRHIEQAPKGGFQKALFRTAQKSLPATVGIIALIVMSKIMGGTGQTMVLAKGTANLMGRLYPLLAPQVGILGAFMTSSNMASNILFANFQQTTASILNLNEASILGAQTAGGAMGNTICPGNILLGTTTAGILGKEGIILRMIIPITISVAIGVGLLLFFVNMM